MKDIFYPKYLNEHMDKSIFHGLDRELRSREAEGLVDSQPRPTPSNKAASAEMRKGGSGSLPRFQAGR